jgi:ribonucleoside-triphosphate reductase
MNSELERTPITFPVTSACFTRDNNFNIKDENYLDFIAEKSLKYGFMNFYIGKSSTISSCCRLRSDLENDYFNSFGAGSSKIGSLGVATPDYPRLAFKHVGDREGLFKELKHLVELCFKVNYTKRKIIEDRINNGYHPLYSLGFIDIDKQYLTQGVNGFNEMIEIMNYDPISDEGVNFGLSVIKVANTTNNRLGKKYGVPVNIEQIPAENTSIKLADKDKLLGYNDGRYDIYSNQFIPLTTNADMLDRIKLQGIYDEHFSGGSICHLNIEQQITDKEQIKDLIRTAAKKGVVYLAVNYNLQECESGHLTVGKKDTCSICDSEIINNYTRVVGFLTNTKNWHKIRREQDYPNRVFY